MEGIAMYDSMPITLTAFQYDQQSVLHSGDYLLLLILNGSAKFQYRDSQIMDAEELFYYAPAIGSQVIFEKNSTVICAAFPVTFFENAFPAPRKSTAFPKGEQRTNVIEAMLDLFDLCYNKTDTTTISLMVEVYKLMQLIEPFVNMAAPNDVSAMAPESEKNRMIRYLEENFRQPIRLADFAKSFGYSRQYISTVFHKQTGLSFMQYLTKLRLEEAERLLICTDKTVADIAESSGFSGVKALYAAFNTEHHMTPGDYRGQNQLSREPIKRTTDARILQNVCQFLENRRLVFTGKEENTQCSHSISVKECTELLPTWLDILNIDFLSSCLVTTKQKLLAEIQNRFHFRYARVGNLFSQNATYIQKENKRYQFIDLIAEIDFLKSIDLIPMFSFGSSYVLESNCIIQFDNGYLYDAEQWFDFLGQFMHIAAKRWEEEWLSQWRFEFCMIDPLYDGQYDFMDLFERSVKIIRSYLPLAQIGGPSIPYDSNAAVRMREWMKGVEVRNIQIDFVSYELWGECKLENQRSQMSDGVRTKVKRIASIVKIDAHAAIQSALFIRELMKDYNLSDKKLMVSALGTLKYHPRETQMGGSCSAYLVRAIMGLLPYVDGIGCWKALINEAEYHDENVFHSSACGLINRFGLHTQSWYAYQFLSELLSHQLFQNSSIIVTSNRKDNYAILIHNLKNYSDYFYKNSHVDPRQMGDKRCYTNDSAFRASLRLTNVRPGKYRVCQQLVGDRYGCVAAVISRLGAFDPLRKELIPYIAGQSQPYQYYYMLDVTDDMELSVLLQANETMLLLVSFEENPN